MRSAKRRGHRYRHGLRHRRLLRRAAKQAEDPFVAFGQWLGSGGLEALMEQFYTGIRQIAQEYERIGRCQYLGTEMYPTDWDKAVYT